MPAHRQLVGSPAALSELWSGGLVRQLTQQTRDKALPHDAAPLVQSFEPGEDGGWCYIDQLFLEPAPLQKALR